MKVKQCQVACSKELNWASRLVHDWERPLHPTRQCKKRTRCSTHRCKPSSEFLLHNRNQKKHEKHTFTSETTPPPDWLVYRTLFTWVRCHFSMTSISSDCRVSEAALTRELDPLLEMQTITVISLAVRFRWESNIIVFSNKGWQPQSLTFSSKFQCESCSWSGKEVNMLPKTLFFVGW